MATQGLLNFIGKTTGAQAKQAISNKNKHSNSQARTSGKQKGGKLKENGKKQEKTNDREPKIDDNGAIIVKNVDGTPVNLGGTNKRAWYQPIDICGAGFYCKMEGTAAVLHKDVKCMHCGWCIHSPCGISIQRTEEQQKDPAYRALKSVRQLCLHCVAERDLYGQISEEKGEKFFKAELAEIRAVWRMDHQRVYLKSYMDNVATSEEDDEGVNSTDEEGGQKNKGKDGQEQHEETGAGKEKNQEEHKAQEEEKDNTGKAPAKANNSGANKKTQEGAEDNKEDKKSMEVDEDDDSSTVTQSGGNKSTIDNDGGSTQAAMEDATIKYIDVQFNQEAMEPGSSPQAMITATVEKCKNWLTNIQSVNKTVKMHTVDPEDPNQLILHAISDFPTDLDGLKGFFTRIRPLPKGGRQYVKVKLSFNGTEKNLISNLDWYCQQEKERFSISAIQSYESDTIGWLLYSLWSMDLELLETFYGKEIGVQVALRFRAIQSGKKKEKNHDFRNDPKAIHIECARKHVPRVEAYFKKKYNSQATKFPFGVRLRYVPSIQRMMDTKSTQKSLLLRNRQAGWCKQHHARSRDDICSIDLPIGDSKKTLRDAIMNIKSNSGNTKTPLYASIDARKKGDGYTFSAHPAKAEEAEVILRGLYARLAHEFGEEPIYKFFTPEAIREGKQMTYDPVTNTVTSEADKAIDGLLGVDDDMDFSIVVDEKVAGEFGERATEVLVKDRGDDDSVSTLHKRTYPEEITQDAKRAKANPKTNDDSTASSLSFTTKHTLDTRMTTIESNFDNMSNQLGQVLNMLAAITTAQANAPSTPSSGQQIGHAVSPDGSNKDSSTYASKSRQGDGPTNRQGVGAIPETSTEASGKG